MSDTNVSRELTPQDVEIDRLENSRQKWRKAGLVFGGLALANVPLTWLLLSNTLHTWGTTFSAILLSYAVFSSIPFLLFGLVCMGVALSRKNSAAKLRAQG